MSNGGTIKATLRIKGGNTVAEIDLPKTLAQVPLNRFIDFLVECRKFGDENENQVMVMARAVSGFCDYPLAEIIEAEIGDVYNPDISGLGGSVNSLFGYISSLIQNAKGEAVTVEDSTFEHDGETYHFPIIVQQALAGEYNLPNLSVIETVEAAEIQRWKADRTQQKGDPDGYIKKRIMDVANAEIAGLDATDGNRAVILKAAEKVVKMEVEKSGDHTGAFLYSMYLKMLAILCRKEGEHMPFEDAQREAWINDRAVKFRGINAQLALNIDFFLTNILQGYGNAPHVAGFLTRQSFGLLVGMQLKSKKPTTGRKGTTKKYSSA